jgi:hypothetical protein
MTLHFTGASMDEVRPLLRAHHYLGKRGRFPGNPVAVFAWREGGGLFGDRGAPVAAVVFTSPAANLWRGGLELSRLVRAPHISQPMSRFVAMALRHLRKTTEWGFVVSYADSAEGHHGGIYQALGFAYLGTAGGGAEWWNPASGETCSRRAFDQRAPVNRRGWERRKTSMKHLYVAPVAWSIEQIEQLAGRTRQPYPKPDKEVAA